MKYAVYLLNILFLFTISCNQIETTNTNHSDAGYIKYSKLLSINESNDSIYINVKSENRSSQTIAISNNGENYYKKIASLSSVFSGFLAEIGAEDLITAVDDINFINNKKLIQRNSEGGLPSIAKGGILNTEMVLKLAPDLIIHSGFGEINEKQESELKEYGIDIFLCNNYLEESPLGRAEWIKAFGILCGKKDSAFALFDKIEKEYLELKDRIYDSSPSVMAGILFGGIWDVPASKSYTAQLIRDAGGNYLWDNEGSSGKIPLSLEKVATIALDADIWINPGAYNSLEEMKGAEERYSDFKAFKTKCIFNNNKQVNSKGGNAFWETAAIRPQVVLKDLIDIFHSDNYSNLQYYQRLE